MIEKPDRQRPETVVSADHKDQGKENRSIMKHKFSEKHPVLGLLACTYGGFLVSEILVGAIMTFVLSSRGFDSGTSVALGGCIGSLLVLIFWYLRNQPEYRFMPRKGEISGSFKLLFLPMLLYWILMFGPYAYFGKGFPFGPVGLKEVLTALMAGAAEEICFREIAVSYMTKHWMSKKSIPMVAIISGAMFGLTHITNALGGSITTALCQAVLCIFMGVFYAAIYLRKGNVWTLCLFHFLHDLLTFMAGSGFDINGVTELPDWITIYIAVIEFKLCLFGFFYIRKAKRQEIVDLWNYKWSRSQSNG